MLSRMIALALTVAFAEASPITRNSGPGIILENNSGQSTEYCFFNNLANGSGFGVPNFNHPNHCVFLKAFETRFVPLSATFKGRVQRGKFIPATWAEFQLAASNDNAAHGDISVEQGMDGAAKICSTDGSEVEGGFGLDLLRLAPTGMLAERQDGKKVIPSTMGNWMAGPNPVVVNFLKAHIDPSKTYISGGIGVDDVASKNQVLKITWY